MSTTLIPDTPMNSYWMRFKATGGQVVIDSREVELYEPSDNGTLVWLKSGRQMHLVDVSQEEFEKQFNVGGLRWDNDTR